MIELLENALDVLGSLADELTFVGGATVGLWITDPQAPPPRATDDVDAVCDATTYLQLSELEERIRLETRLRDDPAMMGRWREPDGLVLDVMPATAGPTGVSNRWYATVVAARVRFSLPSGRTIYAAPPVLLVATKIEAWRNRGGGDFLSSRDAEDILTLIDGRAELADEIAAADFEVREAVREWLTELVKHPYGDYAIEAAAGGYGAASSDRAVLLRRRIDLILEATA